MKNSRPGSAKIKAVFCKSAPANLASGMKEMAARKNFRVVFPLSSRHECIPSFPHVFKSSLPILRGVISMVYFNLRIQGELLKGKEMKYQHCVENVHFLEIRYVMFSIGKGYCRLPFFNPTPAGAFLIKTVSPVKRRKKN